LVNSFSSLPLANNGLVSNRAKGNTESCLAGMAAAERCRGELLMLAGASSAGGATHTLFVSLIIRQLRKSTPGGSKFVSR